MLTSKRFCFGGFRSKIPGNSTFSALATTPSAEIKQNQDDEDEDDYGCNGHRYESGIHVHGYIDL